MDLGSVRMSCICQVGRGRFAGPFCEAALRGQGRKLAAIGLVLVATGCFIFLILNF